MCKGLDVEEKEMGDREERGGDTRPGSYTFQKTEDRSSSGDLEREMIYSYFGKVCCVGDDLGQK